MGMNLNQLAAALRSGGEAQGQAASLQNQMKRAQGVADTPYTKINPNTGYGSPFEAMANALRKDRGAKEARELQPQIAAAQQQQVAGQVAEKMYGLEKAKEQQAYTRGRNTDADARAAEQLGYTRNRNVEQDRIAADAVNRQTGVDDFNRKNAAVKYATGLQQAKEKQAWAQAAPARELAAATAKAKSGSDSEEANLVGDLADAFKDDYANPSGGYPLVGSASNMVAEHAPKFADQGMKDRQAWWSNFELFFNIPQRHEMFGGALTTGESAKWNAATINPNMNADQIRTKLAVLKKIYADVSERTGINPLAADAKVKAEGEKGVMAIQQKRTRLAELEAKAAGGGN